MVAGERQRHRIDDPLWSPIRSIRRKDGVLDIRHLNVVRQLGSGDVGRVYLCNLNGFLYALKVIDRDALALRDKEKVLGVHMESRLISTFDHPFLPTLFAEFDSGHYTCFLMDYCSGGDLHSLLNKQRGRRFEPRDARFFAAEVLIALEYLHAAGIVYRDLKPENILRREDGHIMLSDFDLCLVSEVDPKLDFRYSNVNIDNDEADHAVHIRCFNHHIRRGDKSIIEFVAEPVNAMSIACVGTHEYVAPEIISGNGHGNGVDWWAFGVLLYEMLYGETPFKGKNKTETLWNILWKPLRYPAGSSDVPELAAANNLITRLLVKDPRRRLGCVRGAADVKRHDFFAAIQWPLILTYAPPKFDTYGHRRRADRKTGKVGSVRGRWLWKKLRTWILGSCKNGKELQE